MAYVILVNEDNTLSTTKKERIMQRSKLVDTLWFLVHPMYKENDMTNATVMLEYLLPVSKKYKTEILRLSEDMYEDHLKYLLPFDTELTSEAGEIEVQLTFAYVDLDAEGNAIQRVRKTSKNRITIIPIAAWSDIIPDAALSVIDQRLIETSRQIKQLADIEVALSQNQVDNLKYDANDETLQLMAGEYGVGSKVSVRDMIDDGIPVISFDSSSGDGSGSDSTHKDGCDCGCEDNVVEFTYVESEDSGEEDEDNVVQF